VAGRAWFRQEQKRETGACEAGRRAIGRNFDATRAARSITAAQGQRSSQKPLRRDGRTPDPLVKRRNLASSSAKAAFVSRRIARTGCRAGMRASTAHKRQGPARPILAPHRPPRIASPTPQNHAENQNSRTFPRHFFSSLLARSEARPPHGRRLGEARGRDGRRRFCAMNLIGKRAERRLPTAAKIAQFLC
jgi:hypothetical protein